MANEPKRRAFIFTTDAFLALPLVILAISTFIAFSVTLSENTILQEHAFMVARDSFNYLSEITLVGANMGASNSTTVMDSIVLGITSGDLNSANISASALDKYVSSSSAYILEYKNISSGDWIEIRQGGNSLKLASPQVQVSETNIVTSLTQPVINYPTNCAQEIICGQPTSRYTPGSIIGPIMIRIRVFE